METSKSLYTLVRANGNIIRYSNRLKDGTPVKAWPIAEGAQNAARLASWANAQMGGEAIQAVRIGSAAGETLAGHIELAHRDGCTLVIAPDRFDAAGCPIWKAIEIR